MAGACGSQRCTLVSFFLIIYAIVSYPKKSKVKVLVGRSKKMDSIPFFTKKKRVVISR